MSNDVSATKVVFFQQIHVVVIRIICLFVILYAVKSNAACQKEDVSFYLQKGFNHEQVVKLCDSGVPTQPQSLPHNEHKPPVIEAQPYQEPQVQKPAQPRTYESVQPQQNNAPSDFGFYGNPDAVFLATAVESYDVEVTEDAIIFARKDCFDYGWEDWNGFQERACPNIRYSIARGGLKIVDRDDGFFGLGSTALYISGNITADIIDLNSFKPKDQAKIKSIVRNNTKKFKINVRSGMPQSKVEAILLKLAGQ